MATVETIVPFHTHYFVTFIHLHMCTHAHTHTHYKQLHSKSVRKTYLHFVVCDGNCLLIGEWFIRHTDYRSKVYIPLDSHLTTTTTSVKKSGIIIHSHLSKITAVSIVTVIIGNILTWTGPSSSPSTSTSTLPPSLSSLPPPSSMTTSVAPFASMDMMAKMWVWSVLLT